LVAPAMNPRMWSHAATRANAETLRARGVVLVGPDEGETAEGELGVGRMSEPDEIVREAEKLLAGTGPLAGKKVLISAGGTREPIDAVRFVGNRSSGRMGVALAAEARRRGARVTLLGANLAVAAPPGVEAVDTPTAAGLAREALERAREKLANKNADLFVFNDVGRDDIGFDTRDNEVMLVSAAGERLVAKAPKDEVAASILDEVERLLLG